MILGRGWCLKLTITPHIEKYFMISHGESEVRKEKEDSKKGKRKKGGMDGDMKEESVDGNS